MLPMRRTDTATTIVKDQQADDDHDHGETSNTATATSSRSKASSQKKETKDSDLLLKLLEATSSGNDLKRETCPNVDSRKKKTNTRILDDAPLCLPSTSSTKGTRKRAGAAGVAVVLGGGRDKRDAPRIRVARKRFQETRRRRELRTALDKLLMTIRSHDQEFAKEATKREAKVPPACCLPTTAPLNKITTPLFNRIEMIWQAGSTIVKLREEGQELKKTLESLGGTSSTTHMMSTNGASHPVVFHLGIGPLAFHEVPPVIVPDMTTTSTESHTSSAKARHDSCHKAKSAFSLLVGLPRDDNSNHTQTVGAIPEPAGNHMILSHSVTVLPASTSSNNDDDGFGYDYAGSHSQNALLREDGATSFLVWLQRQMQILGGQQHQQRLQSFFSAVGADDHLMSHFLFNQQQQQQHISSSSSLVPASTIAPAVQSTLQHPGMLALGALPTAQQTGFVEQQQQQQQLYSEFVRRSAHSILAGLHQQQQQQQQQLQSVLETVEDPESEYHRSAYSFPLTTPPHSQQYQGPAP